MKPLKDALLLLVVVVLVTSVRITIPETDAPSAQGVPDPEEVQAASFFPAARAASPGSVPDREPLSADRRSRTSRVEREVRVEPVSGVGETTWVIAPDGSERILLRIEWQGEQATVVIPELPTSLREVGERTGFRFQTRG